jgi:polyisoprenoid-binding protein YceI
MKKYILTLIALAFILPSAYAATWNLDKAHSAVQFSVKHMMVSTVRGTFDAFSGSASYDAANPAALSLNATIEAKSIDTRNEMRDNHLRSADFFEVEKFPTINFTSTKTVQTAPGQFKVTGNLTMHGITKEITLDVTGFETIIKDNKGSERTGATATAKIDRREFGLNWNKAIEAGGLTVSNDVQITIEAELIKAE